MKPARLNLTALRRTVSGTSSSTREKNDSNILPVDPQMSRRRLIAVGAGVAGGALFVPAASRLLGASLGRSFDIISTKNRVAILLGGAERFVIETKRFAGKPLLTVERSESVTRIALTDARWPGLEIPADMVLTIRSGLMRRKGRIEMKLGGFSAEFPLDEWLLGAGGAESLCRFSYRDVTSFPNDTASLRFYRSGMASFTPDWRLACVGKGSGKGIAELNLGGASLTSDGFELALSGSAESGLLKNGASRRCSIRMERGGNSWPLEPAPVAGKDWQFTAIDEPFDRLYIESTEGARGGRQGALVAAPHDSTPRIAVRPSPSFTGANGQPLSIPLRSVRYAVTFDAAGQDAALLGGFDKPDWIHTEGLSLLIGDGGGNPRFELTARNGVVDCVDCAPELAGAYMPISTSGKAIVEPARPRRGTRLEFLAGAGAKARGGTLFSSLRFFPERPQVPPEVNLNDTPFWIVRPDDLLVLGVTFKNMQVQGSGSARKLVRTGSPAYLMLHFQPQNIAEQAFFETDPNIEPDDVNPHDPDASSGAESPIPPPIFSRISEGSRLAFKIPATLTSIDFTLENLLDVCRRLEMSVHSAAAPDEQPTAGMLATIAFDKGIGSAISLAGLTKKKTSLVEMRNTMETAISVESSSSSAPSTSGLERIEGSHFRRSKMFREMAGVDHGFSTNPSGISAIGKKRDWGMTADASELSFETVESAAVTIMPAKPSSPTKEQTAIECPFRLIVSPNKFGRWAHSPIAVYSQRTGRVELWHTRLGIQGSDGIPEIVDTEEEAPDAGSGLTYSSSGTELRAINDFVNERPSWKKTLRAVWSRDWNQPDTYEAATIDDVTRPNHSNEPFRMSLDSADRYDIVQLSANFHLKDSGKSYKPRAITVERLMLSSLGAWMNVRGAWVIPGLTCDQTPGDVTTPLMEVEEWRHRGTMGRDNYVRVVYKGYLFPFGHQASLIKITERKFHKNKPGNPAYLRQRMYIVVREPEKFYPGTGIVFDPATIGGQSLKKRKLDLEWPISRVRLTTLVTPNIDKPENTDYANKLQSLFWPQVGGSDFLFHIEAEDFEGHSIEFTAPLLFVGNSEKMSVTGALKTARDDFEGGSGGEKEGRRSRLIEGVSVSYATADPAKPGDTTFETTELTFGAELLKNEHRNIVGCDAPMFYPVLRSSKIVIPSLKRLAGVTGDSGYRWHAKYLEFGFDGNNNKGEMLFETKPSGPPPVTLSFQKQGDKAGSLVKPNMMIGGLSRKMGPVSGQGAKLDTIASGQFKPTEFFPGEAPELADMLPLIFGCIPLGEILKAVGNFADDLGLDQVPKFINSVGNEVEAFIGKLTALYDQGKKYVDTAVQTGEGVVEIINTAQGVVSSGAAFPGVVSSLSSDPWAARNTLLDKTQDLKGKVDGLRLALTNYNGFSNPSLNSARTTAIGTLGTVSTGLGNIASQLTAASEVAGSVVSQANSLQAQINTLSSQISPFSSLSPSSALSAIGLDPIVNAIKRVIGDIIGAANAASALGGNVADYKSGPSDPNADGDGLIDFFSALVSIFDGDAAAAEAQVEGKLNDFKADIAGLRTALQNYSGPTFQELDSVKSKVVAFLQETENAVQTILDGLEIFFRALEMIRQQKIRFEWKPKLQNFSLTGDPSEPIFIASDKGKEATLVIAAEASLKGGEGDSPAFSVECTMRDFVVELIAPLSFIAIHMEMIQFLAETGKGADVNVKLRDIEFVGPLSFIETLKEIIPLNGFSDPPAIDVSEKGITARFSMALPNIAVGVFSLTNMSIGAGFTIPFIGDPLSVSFFFCSRDNPFTLTVYIFGGGGFFGLTLNPSGIHLFEVAFEFGAAFAIDFGIAGGKVKVVAGIYFKMTTGTDPESAVVTGYLKMQGHVYVAFVGASITLSLELTYESSSGKCTGRASIVVEIDVPLVPSIEITYEEKFAGSNGDPGFLDMMSPYTLSTGETVEPWAEYCLAFAKE